MLPTVSIVAPPKISSIASVVARIVSSAVVAPIKPASSEIAPLPASSAVVPKPASSKFDYVSLLSDSDVLLGAVSVPSVASILSPVSLLVPVISLVALKLASSKFDCVLCL